MPTEEKTFTLTEAQLKRIVAEATAAAGAASLPPGAYRSETGEVFHDVWEPTGRVRTNPRTGKREAVNRKVTRPVHLVTDPTPGGLRATRRRCTLSGEDWYHPTLGWHLRGWKRQTDVEANLGTGATLFEMGFAEIADQDDYESTTSTMHGVDRDAQQPPGSPLDSRPAVPPPAPDDDEDEDADEPIEPTETPEPTREAPRVPVASGKKG